MLIEVATDCNNSTLTLCVPSTSELEEILRVQQQDRIPQPSFFGFDSENTELPHVAKVGYYQSWNHPTGAAPAAALMAFVPLFLPLLLLYCLL